MPIIYAKRKCKNPSCADRHFVPLRPDQLFCDKQCKNHYHNQLKKKKKETVFSKELVLKQNYESLKKLSQNPAYRKSVPELILKHEKVNLTVFTDQGVNQTTNRKILWSHDLGLELLGETPSRNYIIHSR